MSGPVGWAVLLLVGAVVAIAGGIGGADIDFGSVLAQRLAIITTLTYLGATAFLFSPFFFLLFYVALLLYIANMIVNILTASLKNGWPERHGNWSEGLA